MEFLKSDLPRNFALGFLAGAIIVVFQISPDFLPEAVAAAVR